jgi:hypothetical protein
MKGTFFSSDFVRDANGDLRLLEINTDTSANYNSALQYFDYTDFINILSQNNITEVVIVYKTELHGKLVNQLTQVLGQSAPFITTITPIVVPGESIFPFTPADDASKFILRMAYDETAILDSEYAKGTFNLLKLFADNEDASSVVNFYHSSNDFGTYNTLDTSLFNDANIPDVVVKPIIVDHKAFNFYKLGKSDSNAADRYNEFILGSANQTNLIQQYHINSNEITNNYVSSLRSFMIVYGPNLDLCNVGEYEANAVFNLPETIDFDNTQIANKIDTVHYYEFATNFIKNGKDGLLGDEPIVDGDGNEIPISTMVVGATYPSYYVNGAPNTDDYDVLDLWSVTGNKLPDFSFPSTSKLVFLNTDEPFANEITKIVFEGDEIVRLGGGGRLLTYNSVTNTVQYSPVNQLSTDYSIFNSDGNLVPIVDVQIEILTTTETLYMPNMEDVDNFLFGGSKILRLISHNKIVGSCFPAGTKVSMSDGTFKNIEDVVIGDEVLSFNESTLSIESKKVLTLKQPIHNDLVTYHFTNDSSFTCTFDHPTYVNGLELASFIPEWTNERYNIDREVRKIKVGDLVRLATGGQTAIKEIVVLKPEDTQTYIFSVEDNHNFYANNILVHNKI